MLHIVDDEEAIRDSLIWLAQSRRIEATGYDGVQPFLGMLEADYAFSPEGDCLLLDMRMCIDPSEPAQIRRLMQMPQPGFSSSAPGVGVDCCKN